MIVDFIQPNLAVSQFNNMIRHPLNCFIMSNHNDSIFIFKVNFLNQPENFLRCGIIQRAGRLVTQ